MALAAPSAFDFPAGGRMVHVVTVAMTAAAVSAWVTHSCALEWQGLAPGQGTAWRLARLGFLAGTLLGIVLSVAVLSLFYAPVVGWSSSLIGIMSFLPVWVATALFGVGLAALDAGLWHLRRASA
ncbi:MAG: hypothetical protein QOI63_242 [Thermoplasmata archaeon]|nr:hypothetical protein [Thermoplasmata archaeon]